jgi:hypothetical protein
MNSASEYLPQHRAARCQRGLSILSSLFGLVIGALFTVVIVNAFLDSQRKARVEVNVTDIQTIVTNAKRTFGVKNQYGLLGHASAVESGVVPARLRRAGTKFADNQYGGFIGFYTSGIDRPFDAFVLSFNGVPQSDCADIVFATESLARRVDVTTFGGGNVKPSDGVLDVALLATQCESGDRVNILLYIGQ